MISRSPPRRYAAACAPSAPFLPARQGARGRRGCFIPRVLGVAMQAGRSLGWERIPLAGRESFGLASAVRNGSRRCLAPR